MNKKVLIVGGVAGGASTAARLRRIDENCEIIMFERGEYISFANCGLPYYIGETIEQREALLVQTPEAMKARFNIDVRVKNEVLNIDKENKEVEVKNLNTGETYKENYDVLVLSPGSSPLRPSIPGIDAPNIYTLWTVPDVDKIKDYVDNKKPQKAVVIGGGFIGIEVAENLHDRGVEVSLVEMADQVMGPIDFDMAQVVHQHMRAKNIDLHLSDGVKSFDYNDGKTTVTLQSGAKIEADMVMLSIGVRPNSELAKNANLEVNQKGGIVVNEYLKTSDENIYAIGDAIEVIDFVNGKKTMIPLAGPANKQGRICANNIVYGDKETYEGTQGTSIAKVFDLTVANTGHNEKMLNKEGLEYGKDYDVVITHAKSHAGYYPGAIPMDMKVIFSKPDGKVLGAQIVGYDGVDKRIDVLATSLRFGATVYDLKELELAYAPPFSSAKDPVNMAGYVGENILDGTIQTAQWHEIETLDKENSIVLDVRDSIERELGYIKGSLNIPVDELRNRLDELDKDKLIVIYCAIGIRGYIASRILLQNGFTKVKNLSGGYATYSCVMCQEDNSKCGGVTCNHEHNYSESGETEEMENEFTELVEGERVKLNCQGLSCPGPIVQVYKKMEELKGGDVLEVSATDPGFVNDISAWCNRTGNTLLESGKKDKSFYAEIRKGRPRKTSSNEEIALTKAPQNDDKTMVVFSGDLDKAIASFIIANGAAAMGRKVTMFCTFWGLNVIRKHENVKVKKGLVENMFSKMMPRGAKRLGLSQMNFFGAGAKMIKGIMKKHNVSQLEELIEQAMENGVKIIACQMSMDLMGITKEELIDGVDIAGVAAYLGAAEESNVNLFI